MSSHLFAAAAGKHRDPSTRGIKPVLPGVLTAGDFRPGHIGQRMAYVLRVDLVFAVKGFLKWEGAEHLLDPFLHAFHTVLAPRPQLRCDEINHGNATRVHLAGYTEVEGRRINDYGDTRF